MEGLELAVFVIVSPSSEQLVVCARFTNSTFFDEVAENHMINGNLRMHIPVAAYMQSAF
jgi:hypothetical protein